MPASCNASANSATPSSQTNHKTENIAFLKITGCTTYSSGSLNNLKEGKNAGTFLQYSANASLCNPASFFCSDNTTYGYKIAKQIIVISGISKVSVVSPTPTAPIRLKKYKGFLEIEYGPVVIKVLLLYPEIYKAHQSLPTVARPTITAPTRNIIPQIMGVSSHRLSEKTSRHTRIAVKSLVTNMRYFLEKLFAIIKFLSI